MCQSAQHHDPWSLLDTSHHSRLEIFCYPSVCNTVQTPQNTARPAAGLAAFEHTLMNPRFSNCTPDTELQNDHSHEGPDERLPSLCHHSKEITGQDTAEKTPTFIRIWTIPDKLFNTKSENRENWSPSWFWSKGPQFSRSVSPQTPPVCQREACSPFHLGQLHGLKHKRSCPLKKAHTSKATKSH